MNISERKEIKAMDWITLRDQKWLVGKVFHVAMTTVTFYNGRFTLFRKQVR